MLRIDLATTVNRARTDALQRRPYCFSSEGVEREYKRTAREEQGLSLQQRLFSLIGSGQRLRPGLGRNRPCRYTDDRRGWRDILGNHGTSAHNRPIADM